MCGIAGILRFDDRPAPRERVEAMLARIQHRGPDGEGISEHGPCALAHARLSIIDMLSGQQPMHVAKTDEHGDLHLVFNGEIYNHRNLRKKLQRRGHTFHSDHSDTEVLLFGYREWGTSLPKHLDGMFAFAIWDAQANELFLCRDRNGKKPLYFLRRENEIRFASLIPALLAAREDGESTQVDTAALLHFLRLGYPGDQGMIRGVDEVGPAHWMLVNQSGQTKTERYWRPPPISRSSTSLGVVASLKEVLMEAVASRLEADVPLGCFLSGGIDSSVTAALAQKELTDRGDAALQTFSVSMPDIAYDESEHAAAVAEHIGANHTVLQADPTRAMDDLRHLMNLTGDPTADSSLLPTYWLCRAARQHVKVAISGDGGDELFGGYDRYRAIRLLTTYRRWLTAIPQAMLRGTNAKSLRVRAGRLVAAAHAGADPARQYQSMIHLFTDHTIGEMIDAERGAPGAPLGLLGALDPTGTPPAPDWNEQPDHTHAAMRWDLTHYLPFELLRKVDRASMAVALEVRSPLLDTQVCDLAGHLPTSVLMPGGKPKGLLRAVAAELLPSSIAQRPKQGFAVPMGQWLRTTLKDDLHDMLWSSSLDRFGIKQHGVRRMYYEHLKSKADHTHRLFALLQLCLWSDWLRDAERGA